MERKLTAILCADVYGYSRLMGEDEEATIRNLSAHRRIIDGLIEQHRGRFVNSAGDSVLAEFASAVNAVECAVEIQTALKTENADVPLYTAKNLDLVKFPQQPAGLVKLRKEFKDFGLRSQENQLTYAIWRSELNRRDPNLKSQKFDGPYVHSWLARAFNTIVWDWTCQYGMSPGRPLLIVAALAVILSIVCIFAQTNPGPNGGIWAIWDEHRIKHGDGSSRPQQLTRGFPFARSRASILLLALYFSLLSATRIGWRELNVGTWITRIQTREYSLRATGWVRVVSGIQSLVSVYLVALAILMYFEAPFEF